MRPFRTAIAVALLTTGPAFAGSNTFSASHFYAWIVDNCQRLELDHAGAQTWYDCAGTELERYLTPGTRAVAVPYTQHPTPNEGRT